MFYSLDYGLKTCQCSWVLIVAMQCHTYWGVSHVFSPRFNSMKENKPTEAEKRIYDMILAIAIIRFIVANLISLLIFCTFFHWCGYHTNKHDENQKRKQKECLEYTFICMMANSKSKNVLRSYSNAMDS
jgi:hypothetical protein